MTTACDLKDALKDILSRNGALNRIEAQVKSEIFSAVENGVQDKDTNPKPKADEATFIINELVLEYLKFNGMNFTESIFRSEMRHKTDPVSRRLLCQFLNVKPTVSAKLASDEAPSASDVLQIMEKPVPLLYYFVEYFKSGNSLKI